MKPIGRGETADLRGGDLSTVAWTADGSQLVAAGRASIPINGMWKTIIRRFGPTGQRLGPDAVASDNTIMDLKSCGTGVAFSTADPSFGLMSADGRVRTVQAPVTIDMRGKIAEAFTVSADGQTVRFGLGYARLRPVVFDLPAGKLSDAPSVSAGLSPPDVGGLPVSDWENNLAPKFGGKADRPRTFRDGPLGRGPPRPGGLRARHRILAARLRRGRPATLGASHPGLGFGREPQPRRHHRGCGPHHDGTIRWYRWSDGEELLALFIHVPTKRWVAWTPTGYYMASPGAEDLIGWHINRGWNQQADFFPASRSGKGSIGPISSRRFCAPAMRRRP